MPYKVNEDILSDVSPVGAETEAKALPAGANGKFRLAGVGTVLTDEQVEKFGLKGDSRIEAYGDDAKAKELAEKEAVAKQTYIDNAGISPAHQGLTINPPESSL